MLMEGALERIAIAKGCIQRQDIAAKGEQIGKAVDIIGGLREGLNQEAGGEIAANLDACCMTICSGDCCKPTWTPIPLSWMK
jgi:flagellar protein FliS